MAEVTTIERCICYFYMLCNRCASRHPHCNQAIEKADGKDKLWLPLVTGSMLELQCGCALQVLR